MPNESSTLEQLNALRPRTAQQLHHFVRILLALDIPRTALSPQRNAPFDYLLHTFFEGMPPSNTNTPAVEPDPGASHNPADAIVWANRGGGKTLLGAVATLLDLIFKPGIQIRILGGSLAQSTRMYEHLTALLDRPALQHTLAAAPTQRKLTLHNGSTVEILPQSQRAVRGLRVHKLRCDEVELFDPDVWAAAQLVTRSGYCGTGDNRVWVRGSVEALSTMHRPHGLMARLIDRDNAAARPARLLRWNYLDVIEHCPPQRPCQPCALYDQCQGRAKTAAGFVGIDDLIAQRQRSSHDTWDAEMACQRPRRSDSVYPSFDPRSHVHPAAPRPANTTAPLLIAGLDFGLRSPLAFLWAALHDEHVHILDEYIEAGLTLAEHLRHIEQQAQTRGLMPLQWVGVDPAGRQRSSHTGASDIELLRAHGYRARATPSPVRHGIEIIRQRLDHNTLTIHPRCTRLIQAMQTYHFDADNPHREMPVKDGPDHACDALRYMLVNHHQRPATLHVRHYI